MHPSVFSESHLLYALKKQRSLASGGQGIDVVASPSLALLHSLAITPLKDKLQSRCAPLGSEPRGLPHIRGMQLHCHSQDGIFQPKPGIVTAAGCLQ